MAANTKVYFPQGGDSLEVASGGAINIASGGALDIAGTLGSTVTAETAAASIDGAVFTTETEVELGTYANAANAKLDFGTAGSVTGLGGAMCAELDLGAGTVSGSYAAFEAEVIMPTGAATGTRSSFMSMNLSGAGAAAFDTSGYLFDLNGLTANTGKLLRVGLSQVVTGVGSLRVKIGATDYYIPICASPALTS